jgi:hypothetical protein
VKILTGANSKPLIWFFSGLLALTTFTFLMPSQGGTNQKQNLTELGGLTSHEKGPPYWSDVEGLVVRLKAGDVVDDINECWCATPVFEVWRQLDQYIARGELTEDQASNYCPYAEMEEEVNEIIRI